MKRFFIFLVVMFLFIFMFSGCTKSKMKIGFAGGLTGVNSELGISGMYGAMLAVEDINQDGGIDGHPIELVIQDDKNNQDEALKADQALLSQGCIAIVGHYISSMTTKTVPFVNQNPIVMISPTITTEALSGKADHFFRISPSVIRQSEAINNLFKKDQKKNVVAFYNADNKLYAENLCKALEKIIIEEKAIMIQLFSYNKLQPIDSKSNLDIAARKDVDAVLVVAASDDTAKFFQQLSARGIKKSAYLSTWAMTNDLIEHGGSALEGAQGVTFVDFGSKAPAYVDFVNRYHKKYGIQPDFSAIYSYEAVLAIKRALKGQNHLDAKTLATQLVSNGKFQGIQGGFMLDAYGDCKRKVYYCQIQGMNYVSKGEYEIR